MLFVPSGLTNYFTFDNWGANPSATIGTSITPGVSNTKGVWAEVAAPSDLSRDTYGFYLQIHTGATSAAIKNHIFDIGVDDAGGFAYTPIISNLLCGASPSLTQSGAREYFFPFFIKSSSSVAIRCQGSNATAGTVRAAIRFYGHRYAPETFPVGTFSETLGIDTATTLGAAFTPGNAADGTWATIGTTTKPLWWFQLGYGINNATITAEYTYIEVAYGDASNKIPMFKVMHGGTTAETCGLAAQTSMLTFAAFNEVPAGSTIYVRGRCNNAPDTGYHASVVGIG